MSAFKPRRGIEADKPPALSTCSGEKKAVYSCPLLPWSFPSAAGTFPLACRSRCWKSRGSSPHGSSPDAVTSICAISSASSLVPLRLRRYSKYFPSQDGLSGFVGSWCGLRRSDASCPHHSLDVPSPPPCQAQATHLPLADFGAALPPRPREIPRAGGYVRAHPAGWGATHAAHGRQRRHDPNVQVYHLQVHLPACRISRERPHHAALVHRHVSLAGRTERSRSPSN